MDIDGVPAARERRGAGAADKILDAGIGKHIWQVLLGHPQRLDAEEPVEQPRDVGLRRRDVTAIAGQGLQLALLALEAAPEGVADQRRGRGARLHHQ